jgi:hypothetical protein
VVLAPYTQYATACGANATNAVTHTKERWDRANIIFDDFEWTAPPAGTGSVSFHFVGSTNQGNLTQYVGAVPWTCWASR